ncbi:hypothetical protein C8R44DRAFT_887709 [Mycena epipterygia]|nr:hypothetical protein C8R44DRAFT_887709 [Mycena epipterygia]
MLKNSWETQRAGTTKITPFTKLGYIEFWDEEAMRAWLEKHLPKIKDPVPELKQVTDRESRGEPPLVSSPRMLS